MTHRGPPEFRARRMATGIVSLVSRRTASERASPFPKPHPLRSAAHPTCTSLLKCDRIVEPAAAANRVDGRFRGGEHPEPVAVGTDAPARLVRRDHGTVADLFAQRRVGRRGVAGGAVQHVGEAARRHVDAELRPQQVGDLRQRHTHLGVQLDDQGDDAGAELHAGGAQRVGGLQRVAALHTPLTLRAVADLDVKTTHEGAHPRAVLPDTATPRGSLRPRRRSPDRPSGPAPGGSRRPAPAGGGGPAGHRGCAGSPAGTPAAPLPPVLGEGGGLAATRPARSRQLLFQAFNLALQAVLLALEAVLLALQTVLLALQAIVLALQTVVLPLQALAVTLAPRQLRAQPRDVVALASCRFVAGIVGGTPVVFGYRVLDRFSPVEMGPKWTGPSGSYGGSKVRAPRVPGRTASS